MRRVSRQVVEGFFDIFDEKTESAEKYEGLCRF